MEHYAEDMAAYMFGLQEPPTSASGIPRSSTICWTSRAGGPPQREVRRNAVAAEVLPTENRDTESSKRRWEETRQKVISLTRRIKILEQRALGLHDTRDTTLGVSYLPGGRIVNHPTASTYEAEADKLKVELAEATEGCSTDQLLRLLLIR